MRISCAVSGPCKSVYLRTSSSLRGCGRFDSVDVALVQNSGPIVSSTGTRPTVTGISGMPPPPQLPHNSKTS